MLYITHEESEESDIDNVHLESKSISYRMHHTKVRWKQT